MITVVADVVETRMEAHKLCEWIEQKFNVRAYYLRTEPRLIFRPYYKPFEVGIDAWGVIIDVPDGISYYDIVKEVQERKK